MKNKKYYSLEEIQTSIKKFTLLSTKQEKRVKKAIVYGYQKFRVDNLKKSLDFYKKQLNYFTFIEKKTLEYEAKKEAYEKRIKGSLSRAKSQGVSLGESFSLDSIRKELGL